MPFGQRWYEMSDRQRVEAVNRVHSVLMSQVMAVEHSMIELGCDQKLVREFVYRMCVVHQLGERQRHVLLTHLQTRQKKSKAQA